MPGDGAGLPGHAVQNAHPPPEFQPLGFAERRVADLFFQGFRPAAAQGAAVLIGFRKFAECHGVSLLYIPVQIIFVFCKINS